MSSILQTGAVGCEPRTPIYFNPGGSAALYSQLAGVLAGVVFVGLVFILTREDDEQDRDIDRTLHCLFVVLFALVLTSFAYATISGEGCITRAHGATVLAAATFALSVMLAWLGLGYLLRSYSSLHDVLLASQATFGGITAFAVILTGFVVDDAAKTIRGSSLGQQTLLAIPVGIMLMATASGGVLRLLVGRTSSRLLFRVLMTASVGHLVLLTSLFALLVGNTPPFTETKLLPTWVVWLALIPLGVLAGLAALCFPSSVRATVPNGAEMRRGQ